MRQPLQPGGRGTSPMTCLAATLAIACSKAKRLSSGLRLLAGPGADLRLLGPGGEIGVGLGVGHRRHVAADADLTAQRLPVKQ